MEVKNLEKFPKGNENKQGYIFKRNEKNESKCWWGFWEWRTFILSGEDVNCCCLYKFTQKLHIELLCITDMPQYIRIIVKGICILLRKYLNTCSAIQIASLFIISMQGFYVGIGMQGCG